MNEWNLSEVKKNTELPEIYFHSPNFGFDRAIPTAKRSDAHLRPEIGWKDARSHTAVQERAVRGEKQVFMTEARRYRCIQRRHQCQDVDEIRYPENGVQLQIPAAEAAAILQAAFQAQGRSGVQLFFSALDSQTEVRQQ